MDSKQFKEGKNYRALYKIKNAYALENLGGI